MNMGDIKLFVHHKNAIEIKYNYAGDVNDGIKEQIDNPLFKVLKISNCSSFEDIANVCEEFADALEKSSHWFVVDFEDLKEQENQKIGLLSILQRFATFEKPLIFQIGIEKNKMFFFKTELERSFNFLDLNAHVDSIQHDFAKLVSDCIRRISGIFNGDLLALKFDVNGIQSEKDVQLIHEATLRNDILCLRFLMVNDCDLSKHNEIDERALDLAAGTSNGNPKTLAALLDLPFDVNTEFLLLSEDRYNLLNLVDSDGMTILMLAVENGTLECVEYLIKCGAVVHYTRKEGENNTGAADLAYQLNRLDILEVLLNADSKFPIGFDMNKVNEKIKTIATERNELIVQIKNNLLHVVKKFCEENYQLKRIFNSTNEMALDVAIASKHVEIVGFLEQQGCLMSDYLDTERESLQRKVQDELAKHFPQLEDSHIHRLLSRTRFATSSQAITHKSEALEIFLKLNENPVSKSLMKVVQHHPDLDIILDFNRLSTISLNPSSTVGTHGSVLFKIGRIYIGAKSKLPFPDIRDVVGTAAHEICHLVMQILFYNSCKPYTMDDIETETAFCRIVNDYYNARHLITDDIVRSVFSAYQSHVWQAELIVRYPHMIGFHEISNHTNIAKEFPELCNFYVETIQPKIDAFILHAREFKSQMMIAKLNRNLGHFVGFASVDVFEDALPNLNFEGSTSVKIISTTQPNLVCCLLKRKLRKANNASTVFATVNQIKQFHEELTILHNYHGAELIITWIGDCSQNYGQFFQSLQVNKKLILIQHPAFQTSNEESNKMFQKKLISIDVKELKWANLTDASRMEIAESIISFQGCSVKLNELLNENFDGIEDLELDAFFRNEVIQAGELLPLCVGYDEIRFIPRDFGIGKSCIFSTENFGNAHLLQRSVIIYGIAGAGKSTALSNIASQLKSKNPLRWIQLIDLNKHSDSFELLNFRVKDTMDLLVDDILVLKHKEIFRKLLNDDRVILLFDGFDELDVDAQKDFVDLLKLLQETPVKQFWITTRDEHLKTLTDELNDCLAVTIKPLDTGDQIKFIVGYWQTRVGGEDQAKMEQLAGTLVDKYKKCFDEKLGEFLGTLLQVRMLAEVFVPDKYWNISFPNNFDAYWLYSQFITTKLRIFYKEKNSSESYIDLWQEGWKAHERVALNDSKIIDSFNLKRLKYNSEDSVQFTSDKTIFKIGLLRPNADGNAEFIHRTFAEFFVSHYVANNLINSGFDASCELKNNKVIPYFINSYLTENEGVQENLPKIGRKLISKQKTDKQHFTRALEYCKRNNLDGVEKIIQRSIVSVKKDIIDQKQTFSEDFDKIPFLKIIKDAENFTV